MSRNVDKSLESERSFEELLGRASPRPMPSDDDTRIAREAVHEEWQAVTRSRSRSRRVVAFAAAASVLVALAIVVNVVQSPTVAPIQVATIGKTVGSIYVFAESSRGSAIDDLASLTAGQTVRTEHESSVGLNWVAGGSLRIGPNTTVEFIDATSIELQDGIVYFDSQNTADSLVIDSRLGTVRHIGTQYMVDVDGDAIAVSVRDGEVSIDGNYYEANAASGQQVSLTGSDRPVTLAISGYGEQWRWIEATAEVPSFAGKSAHEFLEWVARETGLGLNIAPSAVHALTTESLLGAELSDDPRTALRQAMPLLGLSAEIRAGQIHVKDTEAD